MLPATIFLAKIGTQVCYTCIICVCSGTSHAPNVNLKNAEDNSRGKSAKKHCFNCSLYILGEAIRTKNVVNKIWAVRLIKNSISASHGFCGFVKVLVQELS